MIAHILSPSPLNPAMTFQGAVELNLDAKARLALPTRHREALATGGGLVLTAHPDGCLLLYPRVVWEPKAAVIQGLPDFDPRARHWKRLLVGHAETIDMDSAGRVLVNPVLRKLAGLEKQVMFVGQGTHFEIWDVARWEKELAAAFETAKTTPPPGMENFSL